MPSKLGQLLKAKREATINPLTGRSYTQEAIGELLGVTRSAIKQLENGETGSLDAPKANRLADVLDDLTVEELVEAMGYRIGTGPLAREEAELVRTYRRAPDSAKPGILSIAKSAVELSLPLPTPKEQQRRAVG